MLHYPSYVSQCGDVVGCDAATCEVACHLIFGEIVFFYYASHNQHAMLQLCL